MCITNKKKRLVIPWVWDPVCNFFALKDLLDQYQQIVNGGAGKSIMCREG